jgi:hypothetical protein
VARIPFEPVVQAGIDAGDTTAAAAALAPAAEALVARLGPEARVEPRP